jgi:TonB-linked SusC/RagA family outer membrane protein
MRLNVLFILLGVLLLFKGNVYGQHGHFELSFDNAPLGTVLNAIESQSNYRFAYSAEHIKLDRKVSIRISSNSIKIVLDKLFSGSGIRFEIKDPHIILLPVGAIPNSQSDKNITGIVTDNKGLPLPGVVVSLDGMSMGAITDPEGKFILKIPDQISNPTLVFSFMGMITQRIKLDDSSDLSVVMNNAIIDLDEMVVVGYGTQKKASLVGAISQVSFTELQQASSPSLTNSLAGRVAGVITVMGSGKPGSDNSKIYVRGMATTNSTDPLVLVDGLERDWNQIDPSDIETLSVLKDASATAVFGVRGANGVILITTKRGQKGKPVFNITSRTTIQAPIRLPEYLGSYDFAQLTNEALRNEGKPEEYTESDLEHYRLGDSPYTHPDNDYYKDFLKKTALQQNVNLSARGGTDFLSYFISASILHQEGLYREFENTDYNTNSNYDRYNFRSNLDFSVSPTTKVGVDLTGRLETRHQPNFDADLFDKTRRLPPNFQSYINPNGTMGGRSDETRLAPYALLSSFGNRARNTNVLEGSFKFDQKLEGVTKGLSFRAMVGFNSSFESRIDISEKPELWQYDKFGVYTFNKPRTDISYSTGKGPGRRRISAEYSLNYSRDFARDHSVTAMALYQQSKYWNEFDIPTGYMGFVGRTTYAYKSRYLFEVNVGYNGSMQFARDHRYGFFPAMSLGWVISDENFWKENLAFFDYMKIRGSYGEVGNDKIGNFKYLYEQRYNLMPNEDGWNIKWGENGGTSERAIAEGQPGNAMVTWERAKKSNIGFDARMFNSRFSLTVDYFQEHRVDILAIPYSVPLVFGMNNPQNSERKDLQGLPPENLGIVENKGVDMEIGYKGKAGSLDYFVKGNITFAHNKIIRMDEEGKKYDWQKSEGKRIGQHFGLTDIGLYQREDFLMDQAGELQLEGGYPVLKPGIPLPSFGVVYPGDCKYADLNGDGLIDSYDVGNIGHGTVPEYTYGINLGVSWKNFDLSVLFQGAGNADFYFKEDAVWEFNQMGKVMTQHLGRYNPQDPSSWETATYPLLHPAENPNNHQKTTRWLFSRNYLRLKNAELGYTMPKSLTQKVGISSSRIFVSGNNLITWDRMMNWDPESGSENGSQYPQLRLWSFGIRLTF